MRRRGHGAVPASAGPDAVIRGLPGPLLIDEWQVVPDVLSAVERSVDDDRTPGRFILTGSIDRILKYARHADAGVEHYWIIDPDEPGLMAYRLRPDGSYERVAHPIGDEPYEAPEPVIVTVSPSALVTAEPSARARSSDRPPRADDHR